MIARSCALASYLEARVLAEPRLELLAPVNLNIVCFRYRADDADAVNGEIVVDIQESGIAAPSTHDAGRPARDPRGDRQSPHRRMRHRRAGRGGAGSSARDGSAASYLIEVEAPPLATQY